MKKIFTTMFAMAAMFCASAAVPTYTVSPADGSVIENRDNLKVTFTFSEEVKADSVQFASGPRFNRTMTDAATDMKATAKTISVNVPVDVWGEAVGDEYILSVTLTNLTDKNGNAITISEIDEETKEVFSYDFKAAASYTSPVPVESVKYLGVSPAEGEMSVWEVYNDGWGAVDFSFSREVEIADPDLCAYVEYTLSDKYIHEFYLTSDDVWGDWNFWTGEYNVSMMLPYDEDVTESNLTKISITLLSIYSDGKEIDVPEVVYSNVTKKSFKAQSNASNTAGIAVQKITGEDSFDIYSLQGSIVKKYGTWEDVKGLNPGVYVVNGRKIIVK